MMNFSSNLHEVDGIKISSMLYQDCSSCVIGHNHTVKERCATKPAWSIQLSTPCQQKFTYFWKIHESRPVKGSVTIRVSVVDIATHFKAFLYDMQAPTLYSSMKKVSRQTGEMRFSACFYQIFNHLEVSAANSHEKWCRTIPSGLI